MKKPIIILFFILVHTGTNANIILPAIFSDHMVLQQKSTVTIWGWAKSKEPIKLTVSWEPTKEYKIETGAQSTWSFNVTTLVAGGPYQITIQGYNTVQINDVLIGEVWLGSGQSNMEWTTAAKITNGEEEKAKANYPQIRFFTVLPSAATSPQQHLNGQWVVCTPESMNHFSAVLYFFGREIHEKIKVPVGLICSAWGGTPIETWMSEHSIVDDKLLNANAKLLKPSIYGPVEPGRIYNCMIHPLIPFKIKGALWYQGEANVDNGNLYARSLTTLINSWRAAWGYDFPFYFVQIAPWAGYGKEGASGAIVRDQQRKVLESTKGTGMVVVSDIGDLVDIHPKNKIDVGKRLAAWALHNDYGFIDIKFSGPFYQSYEIKKDKAIIHFNYAEGGLIAKDGDLKEFEILDREKWISASARINGSVVEIDVKSVKTLKGIRFGYRNDSNPNLFNKANLPASCFEIVID